MPISPNVRSQMFRPSATDANVLELIRLPVTRLPHQSLEPKLVNTTPPASPLCQVSFTFGEMWTPAEHERFLEGIQLFPSGPWRSVAEYIGSRNARQVMSHAQKYRQKIARLQNGQVPSDPATRATDSTMSQSPTNVSTTTIEEEEGLERLSNDQDLRFQDEPGLSMEPFHNSSAFSNNEEKISGDDDTISHLLFEEFMENASILVDQQLRHESAMQLSGTANVPFLPWSLNEPFAFGTHLQDSFIDQLGLFPDELMHESSDDIQI